MKYNNIIYVNNTSSDLTTTADLLAEGTAQKDNHDILVQYKRIRFLFDFELIQKFMLTFKTLKDLAPLYLSDSLSRYLPSRPLRSADGALLATSMSQ